MKRKKERELWMYVCACLAEIGFLYKISLPQVERYVLDQILFQELQYDIRKNPHFVDDRGNLKPHPNVKLLADLRKGLKDFEHKYGLTPRDAAGVPAIIDPEVGEEEEDETFGL